MMLRILLVMMLLVTVGLAGCTKEEPQPTSVMDQMKEEAEKAADEAQPVVEEAVEEAEDMAQDAQEMAEEAVE